MQNDSMCRQLRMVGYARVSTDEERQLFSLKNQLSFFEEYSDKNNYMMVRLYADEGIPGKQMKKRDEFMRMIEDAKTGMFDVIVVKDVSRYARNTVDLLTSVRQLKAMGINVQFVSNSFQTLGDSEFVLTLFGAMAQEESANLSRRILFGKDVTAKNGRVPQEILGYDHVDNYTLRINEDEAALVRRIYSMYLSGCYGMATIAAALRSEGILTKKGSEYSEGYIRRILTNSVYCGDLVNHKTQTVDFLSGTRRNVPEEEQYHHHRPELAIVTREDYDKVQDIRKSRLDLQMAKGGDPRRRYTSRYLFSGLVRCGSCGCTMVCQNVPRKNSDKVDRYWRCKQGACTKNSDKCNNKSYVPDYVLQQVLSDVLRECVGDHSLLAKEVLNLQNKTNVNRSLEVQIADKQRSLQKVIMQKEKLIDLYTNGILSMDEIKSRTAKLSAQVVSIQNELAELNQYQKQEHNVISGMDACLEKINRFLALETIDNMMVRKVLSHVEVDPDKNIKFVFKVN